MKKRNRSKRIFNLLKIISQLRGKKGCKWDKKQTHKSLIPDLIEEVEELIEAINKGNSDEIKEELADVFHQVLFHCQIEKEKGNFDFYDVVEILIEKLRRRHPHVFTKKKLNSVGEILKQWEEIKNEEKRNKRTFKNRKARRKTNKIRSK